MVGETNDALNSDADLFEACGRIICSSRTVSRPELAFRGRFRSNLWTSLTIVWLPRGPVAGGTAANLAPVRRRWEEIPSEKQRDSSWDRQDPKPLSQNYSVRYLDL